MSSPPSSHPLSTLLDESTSLAHSHLADQHFPPRGKGKFTRSYTEQGGHENIRVRGYARDDLYEQDRFADGKDAAHGVLGNEDIAGRALGVEDEEGTKRGKPLWLAKNFGVKNSKIR